MTPSPDALTAEGICVEFGGAVALSDVSLKVRPGQALAVLGRNGAGKSTLLRVLSGLQRPNAGRVILADGGVLKSPLQGVAAGVRFVPESGNVFPDMSVLENLTSALIRVRARRERERRIKMVQELFPVLGPLVARRAGTLSGGERQALAVARAVVANPSVLLLDEPTLGLAPRLAADLLSQLERLMAQSGISIVIAEQSARLVANLCTSELWLEVGHVVEGDGAAGERPGVG